MKKITPIFLALTFVFAIIARAQDAPAFAPLPPQMCLEDEGGSVSIDTATGDFIVSMNGETRTGHAQSFEWFREQAYIIAQGGNESVYIYLNHGIRRNVGFCIATFRNPDGSILVSRKIGNPAQLDCFGNGPTGPPFSVGIDGAKEAVVKGEHLVLRATSSEAIERSNWMWFMRRPGEENFRVVGVGPTVEAKFYWLGDCEMKVVGVYEIESDEAFTTIRVVESVDELPPDEEPPANLAPTVEIQASKTEGGKKLKTTITAVADDEDGEIQSIAWFLDGELIGEGETVSLKLKSKTAREYMLQCVVTDDAGARGEADVRLKLRGRR